jgi:hypothetical protein
MRLLTRTLSLLPYLSSILVQEENDHDVAEAAVSSP